MKTRGFSLLEAMTAGTVLIVGVAAIFSAFSTAGFQFEMQRDRGVATEIAEQWMEQVLVIHPGSPFLASGEHPAGTISYDGGGHIVQTISLSNASGGQDSDASGDTARAKFFVTWTVERDTPVDGLHTVRVSVKWQDSKQNWHDRFFWTYRD